MNEQETVTDIIAQKRLRAKYIECDCAEKIKRGEMVSDCYARELVKDIRLEAARLEAALMRECGDAAKLREALMKCQEITLQWQADERLGVAGSIEKPEARSASDALIDIEFVANAALDATEKEGGAK